MCGLLKWNGELWEVCVCMGDGVETKSMLAHDKANGQWEGRNLMGHDELRDMGRMVPMRKEA